MNVNYDLKFGNLFKIMKCFLISNPPPSQNIYTVLHKFVNNRLIPLNFSVPVVIHSFIIPKLKLIIQKSDKAFMEISERESIQKMLIQQC